MAKRGSWYFEGYQSEEVLDRSGRTRQRLVYRGEWYGLGLKPAALRRCKLLCLALAAVCTVVYFLINLFPGQGGMTPWVGGPCLLALVPLIFLWIGLVNFLPARLAGVLMCLAAFLTGFDGRGAWRIFRRDRKKHSSPNSAHTEAACAGALRVELAGPSFYFGRRVEKPALGEPIHPVEPLDIVRSNRLMYGTAFLALLFFCGLPLMILLFPF